MRKRAVSLALCLCMVLSLVLSPVLAVGKHPFTDVAATDWFNDSVEYVFGQKLMTGTSDTTFEPYRTTQRGMIVTILHRLEGTPTVASENPFTDVPKGSNYENAIIWAAENKIVTGYDGNVFKPYNDITRQQMAAILYRYAQMKGYDTSTSASLGDYADSSQISNYARTAMAWANGEGLINGNGSKQLMPTGNATRAQTAAILTRFCQNIVPISIDGGDTDSSGTDDGQTDTGKTDNGQPDTGKTDDTKPPTSDSYTVTFDLNYDDAGVYQTLSVKAGEKITAPTKPTRDKYSFLGWYTDASKGSKFNFKEAINEAITLYAHWNKITRSSGGGGSNSSSYTPVTNYTVTFISDGKVISIQPVVSGNRATAPANPIKEGYTFDGWFVNDTASTPYDFNTAITSNLTLTARWRNEGSYIVIFYTDAETVLSRQTVKAGEQVTQPENPIREGQQFDGWFTSLNSQTGVTKYNFSSAVTADISLYAKWSVPQDYSDPESTEVTANDSYVLSASEMDVLASSNTPVSFYVNTTLTIPYFNLFLDGNDTEVKLYDNGAFKENGDDIPNDGVYTGIYSVNIAEEKDIAFTAKATVGTTEIETNKCEIFVYTEFTDEQIEVMADVEGTIAGIVVSVRQSMANAELDDLIPAIREQVNAKLSEYVQAGLIKDVQYSESSYAYTWVYVGSEIDATQYIYDVFEGQDVKSMSSGRSGAEETEVGTATLFDDKSIEVSINVDYSKGNIAILNYYPSGHPWSNTYDGFADTLRNAGFSVTCFYNFECQDFMSLQDYNSLIMVDSHGNTDYPHNPTNTPMICTEESQTSAKEKLYSKDIKKKRIKKVTIAGGSRVYWIYPKLFTDYYSNKHLSNPIVYLGLCRGYPEPEQNVELVKAITDAGASVACGYSASVGVAYDAQIAQSLVNRLLQGDTLDAALVAAKQHPWEQDPWEDPEWHRHAIINYYGDGNATLYHELQNGNIDQTIFGIYFPLSVYAWQKYGDARTIAKLAGIKPDTAPRMAIISSGFGSLNDETTSSIYQTFLVSESDSTIEFKYNVVSEEPMEYVGTKYNDIFQVDLLSTDGNVLETLAFESINTSEWNPIKRVIPVLNTESGDFFPGGDKTTYHTGWKSVSSDVLKKYHGQLVVLRFTVQDAGDSVYDTAALIDSVVIK